VRDYQKEMRGQPRGSFGSDPIPPDAFELFQWNDLVWSRYLTWMRSQDRALQDRMRQLARHRSFYWVLYKWVKTEEAERFLADTHDPTLFQQYMEDAQGLIFYEQDLKYLPATEWWGRYFDGVYLLKKIGPRIHWEERFQAFAPEL